MFSGSETRRREAAQNEATGSESSEQNGHFHKDVEKTGDRAHHHFSRKIFFEKEGEDRHITLKDRLRQYVIQMSQGTWQRSADKSLVSRGHGLQ